MDKKHYIIAVLEKIQQYLPEVKALITMLKVNTYTRKEIDELIQMVKSSIHKVKDEKSREKLLEAVSFLKKLHKMEEEDREHEKEELNDLLNQIDSL